jgi:hypothetical protein
MDYDKQDKYSENTVWVIGLTRKGDKIYRFVTMVC